MNAVSEYILNKYQIAPGYKLPIYLRISRHSEWPRLLAELRLKVGAEVGVERGRFSEEICKGNPGVKLFCIDAWQAYAGYVDFTEQAKLDKNYAATRRRLKQYGCVVMKAFSETALKQFAPGSLDFVYIDGNHSLPAVAVDVWGWSEKVRSGGIVAGHDYFDNGKVDNPFHVVQTVNAYAAQYRIDPWFVLNGDRSASWMWVKP